MQKNIILINQQGDLYQIMVGNVILKCMHDKVTKYLNIPLKKYAKDNCYKLLHISNLYITNGIIGYVSSHTQKKIATLKKTVKITLG